MHFPAVEPRRAQEAVLEGVEARSPGHATDGGAGGRGRAGRARWAVLWGVHGGSFRGGKRTPSGRREGGHLCDGDTFAVVVRVEVVSAAGGQGGHGGEGDGELRGDGEGRVASHPWAAGDARRQRGAGRGGLGPGGGGGLGGGGEGVGPGGLQGLLRHFGLGGEGLSAGVHEGGPHLWLVGVGGVLPHPIEAELSGVGGAVVGGLTQVWGLGGDDKPPAGLRRAMQISQSERSSAAPTKVHSRKKRREMKRRWRMSGEVEQAGSGESARKKEKQKKCDQPIRRQQWSVHDGMHLLHPRVS